MSKDTDRKSGADEPMHPIERELAEEDARNASDADADDATAQCAMFDFGPYGLLDQRTWARMLFGFALILVYILVTTGLAWGVTGSIFGTWGVPAGEGFHGSVWMYLFVLAVFGFFLTPLALMAVALVGWWAYRLGKCFWPLPRSPDENESTR